MTLPSSPNSISMQQIANEFGYTLAPNASGTRLGDYRRQKGGAAYPQEVGELDFPSIDGGGAVAVNNSSISMSEFRGTQLQQVVNFHDSGRGGTRLIARNRYSTATDTNGNVTVIGGFRSVPTGNSSGTKVHIHVNQEIGSEKTDPQHCALRTGSWNTSTTLQIDIGGSGRVQGAGGNGGDGANGATDGNPGQPGTSGLGVQYTPTTLNIASGGIVSGGFGGGGGGGGAHDHDYKSERTASGSGGGGGAGLPPGTGGNGPNNGTNGNEGEDGINGELAGEGGAETDNEEQAFGGNGGDGGSPGEGADAGEDGTGGEGSGGEGKQGGGDGAAIRRTNNTIQIQINDPTNALNGRGSTTATTVQ